MNLIHEELYWVLIPLGLLYFSISISAKFLKKQLLLDKGLSKKREGVVGANLNFFDRWEGMGFFIKNDIRLIIRNIRARQVVLMGALFLFYGLFFFTQQQYLEQPTILVFSGLFITGGFMITFGQYVPAWDSEYYSFLMCQNVSYRKYLSSKLYLMMFSVLVCTIISFPYSFFGIDVMLIIWASGIFNFGFGSIITLYSGAFNSTPVKLNIKAKAFENTQAFSLNQFLLIIPKLVLPVVLYSIPAAFISSEAGYICLGASGVLGIIFKTQLADWTTKFYTKQKYTHSEAQIV